jgi:hypothetical protein
MKTYTQRKMDTQIFTATLFIIAKNWTQPRCPPTDQWINKMWHIHTLEHYLVKK